MRWMYELNFMKQEDKNVHLMVVLEEHWGIKSVSRLYPVTNQLGKEKGRNIKPDGNSWKQSCLLLMEFSNNQQKKVRQHYNGKNQPVLFKHKANVTKRDSKGTQVWLTFK